MVVSGLPIRNEREHALEIALMALHINGSIKRFKIHHRPKESLNLRIGINSGISEKILNLFSLHRDSCRTFEHIYKATAKMPPPLF